MILGAVCGVLLAAMAGTSSAALIYESATMGAPGQPVWGHLLLGTIQFGGELDAKELLEKQSSGAKLFYSGKHQPEETQR